MSGRVGIVIPAYQASYSVRDVAKRCLEVFPDVLVVDDGSSDGTADEAAKAGVEVRSQPVNSGKGRALQVAFDHFFGAGFDAVVSVDADGQHLPEEIPKLLAMWAEGADLVLGTRDHLFGGMAGVRRVSNRLSSQAISIVAGQPVGDVQTGFRLYTRELIAAVGFPEARFEAESAVVVRAVRNGFTLRSVPVKLGFADGRLTSHYRPIVDSVRIARAVIAARYWKPGAKRRRS